MASDDGNRPAKGEGAQLVKAAKSTEKQLVGKIKADVGEHLVSSFTKPGKLSAKLAIRNETTITQAMTPETANALVLSSQAQYAVPAQEQTRRSKQQTIRYYGVIAVVMFFGILAFKDHEFGSIATGLSVVLSGGVALPDLFDRLKRKGRPSAQED